MSWADRRPDPPIGDVREKDVEIRRLKQELKTVYRMLDKLKEEIDRLSKRQRPADLS